MLSQQCAKIKNQTHTNANRAKKPTESKYSIICEYNSESARRVIK